jgi:type II secretory pathway pseudopilin PulG
MRPHLHILRSARARRAFTLLESTIGVAVFSVIGYGLAVVVKISKSSETAVREISTQSREIRDSTRRMVDELKTCRDASIVIDTLADGNHQVRFMVPIEVAGAATWGIYDTALGSDPAVNTRVGWSVRYTVRAADAANGGVTYQLVRQLLDTTLTVQRQTVIVDNIRSGDVGRPGFRMVRSGAMWEITLSTSEDGHSNDSRQEIFHVLTRN